MAVPRAKWELESRNRNNNSPIWFTWAKAPEPVRPDRDTCLGELQVVSCRAARFTRITSLRITNNGGRIKKEIKVFCFSCASCIQHVYTDRQAQQFSSQLYTCTQLCSALIHTLGCESLQGGWLRYKHAIYCVRRKRERTHTNTRREKNTKGNLFFKKKRRKWGQKGDERHSVLYTVGSIGAAGINTRLRVHIERKKEVII